MFAVWLGQCFKAVTLPYLLIRRLIVFNKKLNISVFRITFYVIDPKLRVDYESHGRCPHLVVLGVGVYSRHAFYPAVRPFFQIGTFLSCFIIYFQTVFVFEGL
jgi:hypothetical protein